MHFILTPHFYSDQRHCHCPVPVAGDCRAGQYRIQRHGFVCVWGGVHVWCRIDFEEMWRSALDDKTQNLGGLVIGWRGGAAILAALGPAWSAVRSQGCPPALGARLQSAPAK